MSVVVLDESLVPVGIVDNYESLIWTERYYAYGDFEIYMHASKEALNLLKLNYYISIPTSERLMIIESRKITASVENGDYLTISGRSLESILTRRIVWNETTFSGNLQQAFKKLLDDNFISPSQEDRKIDRLTFKESTDSRITCLALNAKYLGDSVYTIFTEICDNFKIGFKIELTADNKFEFSLYKGDDRSYSQTTYPYVIFSKNFENLISSEYSEESGELKNVALIGGEAVEGKDRKFTTFGEATGLNRREIYVDANDISSKDGETELSESVYLQKLRNKGSEELVQHASVTNIDANVDFSMMYVANRDYFMGDEVQVIDEYNIDTRARITELIKSYSDTGTSVRPTFTIEENYKLPAEYQEVEYLQSSGNQYINTAIIPSSGMAAEVVFRFTGVTTNDEMQVFAFHKDIDGTEYSNNSTYTLGSTCWHDGKRYKCIVAIEEPEEWTREHWQETDAEVRWQCGVINKEMYSWGYFSYSGTDPTLWTTGYGDYNIDDSGASMYLFAQDKYETGAAQAIGGIKQVKKVIVRQNGATIAHLVPCFRVQDGRPGMYDLVRDVFFTNIGTGEFEVGPNVGNLVVSTYDDSVPYEYQKVDYIETDGTGYIDTGLITRSLGDRINYEFRAYFPSTPTGTEYPYLFGAQAWDEHGLTILYNAFYTGTMINQRYVGYDPLDFDALITAPSGTIGSSSFEHILELSLKPNTTYTIRCNSTKNVLYANPGDRSNWVTGTTAVKSSTPREITTGDDGMVTVALYNRSGIEAFTNKTVWTHMFEGVRSQTYNSTVHYISNLASLPMDITIKQQIIDGNKLQLQFNNTTRVFDVGTNKETNTLLIYASRKADGSLFLYDRAAKLYYLAVKNGDNLVAFYQPVYRKSDGAVGVYDIVAGKFIAATGGVSKGPDELPTYPGPYDVSPDFKEITLNTDNTKMDDDIVIRKIPDNAGHVSKEGDTLNIE